MNLMDAQKFEISLRALNAVIQIFVGIWLFRWIARGEWLTKVLTNCLFDMLYKWKVIKSIFPCTLDDSICYYRIYMMMGEPLAWVGTYKGSKVIDWWGYKNECVKKLQRTRSSWTAPLRGYLKLMCQWYSIHGKSIHT